MKVIIYVDYSSSKFIEDFKISNKFLEKHKITAHIYVLFTVMISFILFNASNCTSSGVSSVTVAFNDVKALFGG